MTAIRWVDRSASLVSGVVLARLLAPEAFGLIALSLTAIQVLQSFTELGFEGALIHRSTSERKHFDVAWTYGRALRGLVLFVVVYSSADWVAGFYEEPRLAAILQVLALREALKGANNIGVVVFFRDLQFRKQFLLQATEGISRLVAVIPLAFFLENVWAIVAAYLVGSLVRLVASYAMHPFRPHFNFDLRVASELFSFGGWLAGTAIVDTVRRVLDRVVIGRVLGTTVLGFYQIGSRFGQELMLEVYHVVGKVMFPAYSRMQDDPERLRKGFLVVLHLTLFVIVPASLGLALTAEHFVVLVLGSKWMPSVPVLQILVLSGIASTVANMTYPLLRGIGSSRLEFVGRGIQLFLLSIVIVPATTKFGMLGTASGIAGVEIIMLAVLFGFVKRVSGITIQSILGTVLGPVACASFMGLGIIGLSAISVPEVTWFWFFLLVAFGSILYSVSLGAYWVGFQPESLKQLARLLKKLRV